MSALAQFYCNFLLCDVIIRAHKYQYIFYLTDPVSLSQQSHWEQSMTNVPSFTWFIHHKTNEHCLQLVIHLLRFSPPVALGCVRDRVTHTCLPDGNDGFNLNKSRHDPAGTFFVPNPSCLMYLSVTTFQISVKFLNNLQLYRRN